MALYRVPVQSTKHYRKTSWGKKKVGDNSCSYKAFNRNYRAKLHSESRTIKELTVSQETQQMRQKTAPELIQIALQLQKC